MAGAGDSTPTQLDGGPPALVGGIGSIPSRPFTEDAPDLEREELQHRTPSATARYHLPLSLLLSFQGSGFSHRCPSTRRDHRTKSHKWKTVGTSPPSQHRPETASTLLAPALTGAVQSVVFATGSLQKARQDPFLWLTCHVKHPRHVARAWKMSPHTLLYV